MASEHDAPVDGVTWSSCGNYLASFDVAAQVIVWDVRRGASLHAFQHDTPLCALQWSPTSSSQIAMIDSSGQIGVWHEVLTQSAAAAADLKATQVAAANAAASSMDNIMPDDDDDNANRSSMFDDQADDDDDDDDDDDNNLNNENGHHHRGGGDDDDDDDDIPRVNRLRPTEPPSVSAYTSAMTSSLSMLQQQQQQQQQLQQQPTVFRPPELPAQRAFQPGATPLGKKRRFLCYTLLGFITSLAEGAHWTVEVKFADRAVRPVRFTEHDNMSMAAMNAHGAVFASRIDNDANADDDTALSTIMYRAFDSWSSADADWRLMLDVGEQVEAVALGDQWVAAATDRRYVRLMSVGGVQRMLFSLPGDVVTMAGKGDVLAVVYHAASVDNGSQRLALQSYSVSSHQTTWRGALPLSPRSVLTWLGFADGGSIVCGDSKGVVRVIEPAFSSEWVPIADTRSHQGDKTLWPIGLSGLEQLVCIETEPDEYPRPLPEPIVTAVPLAVPLTELASRPAALIDEAHLRDEIDMALKKRPSSALSTRELSAAQAAVDRRLLGAIKELIESERLVRALDLCEQLGLRKSITIAATIANRLRQPALEDRIYELLETHQSSSSSSSTSTSSSSSINATVTAPRTPTSKHSVALDKTIQLLRSPSDVGISAAQKAATASTSDSDSDNDNDNDNEEKAPEEPAKQRRRSAPFSVAKRSLNVEADDASIFASISSMSSKAKRQRQK